MRHWAPSEEYSVYMSRQRQLFVALLLALPICVLAVWSIGVTASSLFNPCVSWGGDSGSAGADTRPCKLHTMSSETRAHAIIVMLAVPGMMLLATFLAAWGAAKHRPRLTAVAAVLMFLEAVPLALTAWPLPVLASAGFFWVSYRDR